MGKVRTKNWLVWAKRSLFGYTVTFLTVQREYTVKHRFLRAPIMTQRPTGPSLRRRKITSIIFDESTDIDSKEGSNE